MRNITLNAGGICGGIAGLAAGIALVVYLTKDGKPPEWTFKVIIPAVIGGAVGCNFFWGLIFPKDEAEDE
ncbi:MAG: hypothetical protein K8T91_19060 [Planctomycetes bacterium]|nr:hypothetical protein [Planctomycetota bacterium]